MASASAKDSRPEVPQPARAALRNHRYPAGADPSPHLGRVAGFPVCRVLLYLLLDKSLQSEQGFQYVKTEYPALPAVKQACCCSSGCSPPLRASIRHLLLDLDKGVDLKTARPTS